MLDRLSRRAEAVARRALELTPFPQPPLRPTHHPVVLMHGFGAIANAAPGGVLHPEAMHLRAHGVWAYAPHVNPYDTVAVRAAAWGERLERVFEETGAERVNLVGFSLGGLDARHLAAQPGWEGRIASIVTVATPHHGTPVARHVLDRPDRLGAWALAAMDFMGRAAWDAAPPQAAAALAELTPEHVEGAFNPRHPCPDGVWCASHSSRAGRGTAAPVVHPGVLLSHRILARMGLENDGMVPTQSALWGEHLGTLDADHARLVGLRVSRGGLDSKALYLGIAERLRERGL